ncbi:C-type lectin domain family 17, member A isoform X4 [Dermochelys coriacea]|uniref:C-type lectin domain family 17, member A isoform X4 n=1 Tax=Dermochelys coriacea TaxID=27794 RepID=UPI001CA7C68B|nr:C-type lectin domain family 17, member A isoform X4 [Dermochelys coriacea]
MAHMSDYGNWMGHSQSKGKKPVERRGAAAESDNEDDYENVSLENCPKPPPLPRGKKVKAATLNQKDKGGAGLAATPGRPRKTGLDLSSAAVAAAFQPPGGDLLLPKPASRRGCPGRSLLITYVLLGVCFLMCSVFLVLALMKRPELQQESEELNFHLLQRAANVSQNLADWEKIRAEIVALQKTVDAVHRSVSGELASVKQFRGKMQEQISALQKRAFMVKSRTTSRVYWLGLSDQKMENQWLWVDGSPLNLSFWSTGEPNDSSNEDCGTMATDGRWNDINCYMTDYWICEKPWLC